MADYWAPAHRAYCLSDAREMIKWEQYEREAIELFRKYRKQGVNSQARVQIHVIRLARLSIEGHARSIGKDSNLNDRIVRSHREYLRTMPTEVRNAS